MRSEIRQNKATRNWVIYSEARSKRPKETKVEDKDRIQLPDFQPDCPFCPDGEASNSHGIFWLPGSGEMPWNTKVIANKFPAVVPDVDPVRFQSGIYIGVNGYGHHEVVLETPFHNRHIGIMSGPEVFDVLRTYHARYIDLKNDERNLLTIVFRNHGAKAGTSLAHPHSQIIALGIVPTHISRREEEAQRYFYQHGTCVFCDLITHELSERRRIVFDNDSFVGFIQYAAEVPFETWIMPKRHTAEFGQITRNELKDLTEAVRNILSRLYVKLDDPDYNYVINSATRYETDSPYLHWYLQIRPRLTTAAGFEIGSGMTINPSYPEKDADFLNE